MAKFYTVLKIGIGMFFLGFLLLFVLSLFSGHKASGASSLYNESLSLMGEKSAKARQAALEDCKARERVRILFLLDYNTGDTTPSADEVMAVKQRLASESCFLDQAAQ